jgi:hypothetical protein
VIQVIFRSNRTKNNALGRTCHQFCGNSATLYKQSYKEISDKPNSRISIIPKMTARTLPKQQGDE